MLLSLVLRKLSDKRVAELEKGFPITVSGRIRSIRFLSSAARKKPYSLGLTFLFPQQESLRPEITRTKRLMHSILVDTKCYLR